MRRAPAVDDSGATVGDRGGNWGEASGEPGATDVHVADVEKNTGPSGGCRARTEQTLTMQQQEAAAATIRASDAPAGVSDDVSVMMRMQMSATHQ